MLGDLLGVIILLCWGLDEFLLLEFAGYHWNLCLGCGYSFKINSGIFCYQQTMFSIVCAPHYVLQMVAFSVKNVI